MQRRFAIFKRAGTKTMMLQLLHVLVLKRHWQLTFFFSGQLEKYSRFTRHFNQISVCAVYQMALAEHPTIIVKWMG